MYGLMLLMASVGPSCDWVAVDKDVQELDTREFSLPIIFNPLQKPLVDHLVVYVSEDRGKTWKCHKEVDPSVGAVDFRAEHDGLYWFALQVVKFDRKEPEGTDGLVACQKVYVNTQHKSLKPQRSREELQRDVEELQKQMDELRKKLDALQTELKGK